MAPSDDDLHHFRGCVPRPWRHRDAYQSSTLYRWVKAKRISPPLKIGPQMVRFRRSVLVASVIAWREVLAMATKLECSACGATADAACECGVAYVPAGLRAAKAVAENLA